MNPQDQIKKLQDQIATNIKDIADLNNEFYRNNFSGRQDFTKYSNFTSRLKVPHYDSVPSTCEVGEICESGGKLKVCSAANTWTTVGTQT